MLFSSRSNSAFNSALEGGMTKGGEEEMRERAARLPDYGLLAQISKQARGTTSMAAGTKRGYSGISNP